MNEEDKKLFNKVVKKVSGKFGREAFIKQVLTPNFELFKNIYNAPTNYTTKETGCLDGLIGRFFDDGKDLLRALQSELDLDQGTNYEIDQSVNGGILFRYQIPATYTEKTRIDDAFQIFLEKYERYETYKELKEEFENGE